MLFEDEIPQEKGLFTFYREQAEKEDQLILNKQFKRDLQMLQLKSIPQLPSICSHQNLTPVKLNSLRKANSLKQHVTKVKPFFARQRLQEAVVDMSQHIQKQKGSYADKQQSSLRQQEPKFAQKSRLYKRQIEELNNTEEHVSPFFQGQKMGNHLHVQPYHLRNQSQDLSSSRNKAAIHTTRGSMELPDIRKVDEQRSYFKPKKGIKSQFIEQALKLKDLEKIKNMRYYLKERSSAQFQQEEEMKRVENLDVNSKSFEAFKLHQQRLLSVLKKFKRKL